MSLTLNDTLASNGTAAVLPVLDKINIDTGYRAAQHQILNSAEVIRK